MALTKEQLDKALTYNSTASGPSSEAIAILVAHWQATHGLTEDGGYGPATTSSVEALRPKVIMPGYVWKPWQGPLAKLPRNRQEVYAIFGNPGAEKPDPAWEKQNIVTVRDLPGVPSKWYFQCHRLAEPYFREGLRRAALACPAYQIARAASYVFRHQRHDPSQPLSTHSWGIAIDVDADLNFAKEFPKGKSPEHWTPAWMQIWPKGLPQEFVAAMQSVGFTWGSDWDDDGRSGDETFQDPMHFELVDRSGP